jgi:glycosyltransferase involved in cell wall biosynthesis
VGGILDVVLPGKTGVLVPPYDAAILARALELLLADPEKRRQYGENGRRRVEEHFRLARETDEWCQLFDQVAGRFTTETRRHGVVHGVDKRELDRMDTEGTDKHR